MLQWKCFLKIINRQYLTHERSKVVYHPPNILIFVFLISIFLFFYSAYLCRIYVSGVLEIFDLKTVISTHQPAFRTCLNKKCNYTARRPFSRNETRLPHKSLHRNHRRKSSRKVFLPKCSSRHHCHSHIFPCLHNIYLLYAQKLLCLS